MVLPVAAGSSSAIHCGNSLSAAAIHYSLYLLFAIHLLGVRCCYSLFTACYSLLDICCLLFAVCYSLPALLVVLVLLMLLLLLLVVMLVVMLVVLLARNFFGTHRRRPSMCQLSMCHAGAVPCGAWPLLRCCTPPLKLCPPIAAQRK
jgi:hypothetical protein